MLRSLHILIDSTPGQNTLTDRIGPEYAAAVPSRVLLVPRFAAPRAERPGRGSSDRTRRGAAEPHGRSAPRPIEASPLPVLLVDDSPQFLHVARRVLERATPCFAVHTVASGEEAVAFLRGEPPFVDAPRPVFVLLDFNLPDIDAPTVLRRVRDDAGLRTIPFLVLTQTPWPDDEAAARAAGASAYQAKPSRVADLRDLVVDFWRTHRAGDDPAG